MHSRNAGLQRLRSITKRIGLATTVLTGIFAGLAAAGSPGHHARAATREPVRKTTPPPRTTSVSAPPSLPPIRNDGSDGNSQGAQPQPVTPQPSSQPQPAPVEPQAPPVVTESPPVTSSGGS